MKEPEIVQPFDVRTRTLLWEATVQYKDLLIIIANKKMQTIEQDRAISMAKIKFLKEALLQTHNDKPYTVDMREAYVKEKLNDVEEVAGRFKIESSLIMDAATLEGLSETIKTLRSILNLLAEQKATERHS